MKLTGVLPNRVFIIEKAISGHLYFMRNKEKELMGWIDEDVKSIYGNVTVKQVKNLHDIPTEELDSQDTLIVFDRHNDIMENSNELSNWPYKSSIFVLPFENYVHHYRDKKGVFEATAKPEHIFMILAESLGIS